MGESTKRFLLFIRNNFPLNPIAQDHKKKKDCCKAFKKGDRCKKCPGHK